jgi:hypothetical protein
MKLSLLFLLLTLSNCAHNGELSKQELSALENMLTELVGNSLKSKSFEQPEVMEQTSDFEFKEKILGQTIPIKASLIHSYKAAVKMPNEKSDFNLTIKELVRIGDRHYQLRAPITLKGISTMGAYKARIKQAAVGSPKVLDADLKATFDLMTDITMAVKWNKGDAISFDLMPLRKLEDRDGKKVVVGETKELFRLISKIENLRVEGKSIEDAIKTVENIAGAEQAKKFSGVLNGFAEDGINEILTKNKDLFEKRIVAAIKDAKQADKLKMGILCAATIKLTIPRN